MEIRRDRYAPDGAVNPQAWDDIRELEKRANEEFIDFVRESGEINTEDYHVRVTDISDLPLDIAAYFASDRTSPYLFEWYKNPFGVMHLAYNLNNGHIVQRSNSLPDGEFEYYEYDEFLWHGSGKRLLDEIFVPGTHPELSDVAQSKKAVLIDPEKLPARITTPEEHQKIQASAKLGIFTVNHLARIYEIYKEVAYPESDNGEPAFSDLERIHNGLMIGGNTGMRKGTKHLSCAKHQFDTSKRDDSLVTWMYLNYDIPIASQRLHFSEDIEMAVEFGEQASEYFQEEGIAS